MGIDEDSDERIRYLAPIKSCAHFVRFCGCSMFCCTLLYVHSRFAVILIGEERAGCFAFAFVCLPGIS